MTILFINIFTGISIDEIQKLIKHSEAQITSRKIEYVFKLKRLNKIYFQDLIYKKLDIFQKIISEYKCFQFFSKQLTNIKEMVVKIKDFLKYETDRKKNIDLKNNSNEEFDRMKNQINELKMIIQSKFESMDRNMKKGISNLEEGISNLEVRFEQRLKKN